MNNELENFKVNMAKSQVARARKLEKLMSLKCWVVNERDEQGPTQQEMLINAVGPSSMLRSDIR